MDGKCTYTKADQFDEGDFVPLQNAPLEEMYTYCKYLADKTKKASIITPKPKRSTRQLNTTVKSIQIEQLEAKLEKQAALIEAQQNKFKEIESSLEQRGNS